jgi:hypothetical protein
MSAAGIIAATLQLITLHAPDGRAVHLAPSQITALGPPRRGDDPRRTINPSANCLVFTVDRHQYAVLETCDAVQKMLGGVP